MTAKTMTAEEVEQARERLRVALVGSSDLDDLLATLAAQAARVPGLDGRAQGLLKSDWPHRVWAASYILTGVDSPCSDSQPPPPGLLDLLGDFLTTLSATPRNPYPTENDPRAAGWADALDAVREGSNELAGALNAARASRVPAPPGLREAVAPLVPIMEEALRRYPAGMLALYSPASEVRAILTAYNATGGDTVLVYEFWKRNQDGGETRRTECAACGSVLAPATPPGPPVDVRPDTMCHSDRDGDCYWEKCPQNKPETRASYCPLASKGDDDR